MWDKFDINIRFKEDVVKHLHGSTPEKPIAYVDFQHYDFPLHAPDVELIDGKPVIRYLKNRDWDSISSGISGMAVGFWPKGQGLDTYPSVTIKASPAKILQGHNVFGSEFGKEGIKQMFLMLAKGSDRERAKLYKKLQELLADLEEAKKTRNHFRVDILSDQRLLDFATDLHRFEATLGARKLEDMGIPTNVFEFLKFEQWFFSVHKLPLCQYLWGVVFDPILSQFEGHSVKNVDDTNIRLQIDAKYIVVKDNGKICKRKANAVFKTYCDIKREGYATLVKTNNQTFFRNVKYLHDCGISKAFLKSLDPHKPDLNVISFPQIIKIDFSQQRPDWYVEPVSHFDCESRQLRLVG